MLFESIIEPFPYFPLIIIGFSLVPSKKTFPSDKIIESVSKVIFTPCLTINFLSFDKKKLFFTIKSSLK